MQSQIELLSRLGITLLQLQATEHVIKLVMQFVLPSGQLTLAALEAQEEKERTKTLGYFLQQLRKRVAVAPEFDDLLLEFLRDRNRFVHNLADVPGWDVDTEEGRRFCIDYLNEFYNRIDHVLKLFSGLVRLWEDQNNLPKEGIDEHPFFKEVDSSYSLMARLMFSAKK